MLYLRYEIVFAEYFNIIAENPFLNTYTIRLFSAFAIFFLFDVNLLFDFILGFGFENCKLLIENYSYLSNSSVNNQITSFCHFLLLVWDFFPFTLLLLYLLKLYHIKFNYKYIILLIIYLSAFGNLSSPSTFIFVYIFLNFYLNSSYLLNKSFNVIR